MKTVVLKGDQPLIVPILSDHGLSQLVKPGEPFQVPDDVAGQAPDSESGDLGSGLLAQTDVWAAGDEERGE